jgi:uncharacterized protein (TIGR02678 family)
VTLLFAEHLAGRVRSGETPLTATEASIATFLREATGRFGRFWRKSAREPGAEHELARIALDRLHRLHLITRTADRVEPLPAIARFALGDVDVQVIDRTPTTASLF